MKTSIIAAAGLLCPCAVVFADLVVGVTPSSNLTGYTGLDLMNTVNGAGLPGGIPTLLGRHDTASPDNAWATIEPGPGHLDFDLAGTLEINGFTFWNVNDGGPSPLGISGIRDVVIQYSTNGVDYLELIGAPDEFAQISTITTPGESFTFAPINASHIRVHVRSNWGDPIATIAFAEIQFSSVPPPASAALFTLGGLMSIRRRPR